MRHLSIDIETYCDLDLTKVGLYKYVQSPFFQIMIFAYSYDGAAPIVVDLAQGEKIPEDVLFAFCDQLNIKHAYNASFEFACLSKFYHTILSQWQCTMIHAYYCGYPGGLGNVNDAMGIAADKKKSSIGKALIQYFCKPCKPTKNNGNRSRNLPRHDPARWELFKAYCAQDVVAEMEVERRLAPWPVPESEWKLWQLDNAINAQGVLIDKQLVSNALDMNSRVMNDLEREAVLLSGLDNPNSVKQLKVWLEEETEEEILNVNKATVKGLISNLDDEKVKRVLEIRQEMSKTSIKKYAAMESVICSDGRVRGLLQFYGTRTGRWAGRLIQVQNLPKNYLSTLNIARNLVIENKLQALKVVYGNVPDTLSQLIRTAFVPSDGNVLMIADFSAIEARVIAWLAGEQWRQEVFATHGKIYEASASAMFGIPLEKIVKNNPEYELRSKGKVAELALGYQGGTDALIAMGALKMGLQEDELGDIVSRWRKASPRIVDLWYKMQNCAIEALRSGRPQTERGITFTYEGNDEERFLTILLPSGRKLFYVKPFLCPNQWGRDSIYFYSTNQISKRWQKTPTYGGKLVENIIQAIARDCLAVAMQRLDRAGFKTIMHIHDESVIDVPIPLADLEKACKIMGEPIPWAPGLILTADGFISKYYKKD